MLILFFFLCVLCGDVESGAFFLHLIHSNKSAMETSPQLIVDAVYWLETGYLLEQNASSASLLKNLGLAHIDLLQNNALSKRKQLLYPSEDIFGTLKDLNWPNAAAFVDWKQWSMEKFTFYWGAFLDREDAKYDGQYETIKAAYLNTKKAMNK